MDNYILDRLRADGLHLLKNAANENKIQHCGVRGRFRELLINNILSPWLPPYVLCGTGTIISGNRVVRNYTQDDIILFDRSLTPPVLATNDLREGIFLFNSVLARIEVKSTVKSEDWKNFCKSSLELQQMKYSVKAQFETSFTAPFNLFFAYESNAKSDEGNFELKRLINAMNELNINPLEGLVSMICIPGKGFWKLGKKEDGARTWQKLISDEPEDHIAWVTACISNSCFDSHTERLGRDSTKSLEGGIGMYLDHPFSNIDVNMPCFLS